MKNPPAPFPSSNYHKHLSSFHAAEDTSSLYLNSLVMLNAISMMQYESLTDSISYDTYISAAYTLMDLTESKYAFICELAELEDQQPVLKLTSFVCCDGQEMAQKQFSTLRLLKRPQRDLAHPFFKCLKMKESSFSCNESLTIPEDMQITLPENIVTYTGIPIFYNQKIMGMVGLINRQAPYTPELIEFIYPLLSTLGNIKRRQQLEREREAGEIHLKSSQKLLKSFVEHTPAPMIMVDPNLNHVESSLSWLVLFQIKPKEADTLNLNTFFQDKNPNLLALFTQAFQGKKIKGRILKVFLKNHKEIWVKVSIEQWQVHATAKPGLMIFTENVTNLKHAQQALRQKNKTLKDRNHELASFAHVCAHDFKQPLRTISSFSQLVQSEGLPLSETQQKYLNHIQKSCTRLNELVQDILCFAQTGMDKISVGNVDLVELLSEIQADNHDLIQEKNTVIQVEALGHVRGVKSSLKLLFQNLLSNAIKFNRAKTPTVSIKQSETEGLYIFNITDNGIGIKKADQKRIFQMFERVDWQGYEGTGLGLSLCRKIIETHGGTISIHSKLHHGTTISFTLKKDL